MSSRELAGEFWPELDADSARFLAGRQPTGPGPVLELWRFLWEGQSPRSVGPPVLARCLEAVQTPELLREPPPPAGFLHAFWRLLAWTRELETAEEARPGARIDFRRLQSEGNRLESIVPGWLPLQAWFWREKARLIGMQGGDPLPWLERSLRRAGELQQWEQVARARLFLNFTPSHHGPVLSARQRQELQPLLDALPEFLAAESAREVRERFLERLLQCIPLQSALWLEKKERWEVLNWAPQRVVPRFSASLAEQCLVSQELVWGSPEQISASRSLLLSDIRSLVTVPFELPGQVLFAWQSHEQPWLSQEQIQVLQFLVELASQVIGRLDLAARAEAELSEASRLHERWETIFQGTPELAMAELDEQGRVLRANPALKELFPAEVEQQKPLPPVTKVMRLAREGMPHWYQVSEWDLPGESGRYRAYLDISGREVEHWFDYVDELRHRLASDLHDGPAQVCAALHLSDPGPATQTLLQETRELLEWLRSPWWDGTAPATQLQEFFRLILPDCELELANWPDDWPRSRQQFLLRSCLGVGAEVARQHSASRLSVGAQGLRWEPASVPELPPALCQVLNVGSAILGLEWQLVPGACVLQTLRSGQQRQA